MTTDGGRNTPAPWVPFTRAGCSFGAVAMGNTVLENTRFDTSAVFGPGSPEAQEEREAASIPCGFGSNPPCTPDQQKAKNRPQTDFVGMRSIAVGATGPAGQPGVHGPTRCPTNPAATSA